MRTYLVLLVSACFLVSGGRAAPRSKARTLDLSGLLGQLDLANLQDLLSNANEQTLQDILDDQTLQDLAQNLLNNLPDPGNDGAGAGGFLGNLFNGVRPPRRRPFRPVGPFRTVG